MRWNRGKLVIPYGRSYEVRNANSHLSFARVNVNTHPMNVLDLTPIQLKRAAAIKEQIENLNMELRGLFGVSADSAGVSTKRRTLSTAAKRKIAAAQKARWRNLRRSGSAPRSAEPNAKAKKKTMSPARRAKLSSKLKAYWAAKKAGKK
jgi:hypothetical protein